MIDALIAASWLALAGFAVFVAFIQYIVLPSFNNPILTLLNNGLKPVGLLLIVGLLLSALFKYRRARAKHLEPEPLKIEPFAPKTIYAKPDEVYEPTMVYQREVLLDDWLQEPPSSWTLALIQEIEWKRFEALCVAFYSEKGIRAEPTGVGADGGIDIKLYQRHATSPTSLVQCKAWSNRLVGVKEMREFVGVLTHEKVAKGYYITSGDFSAAAKAIAKANQIIPINGAMLLEMIVRLPAPTQLKLLLLATEGDYKTPTCASCDIKMVKRKYRTGEIWGCINFPRCKTRIFIRRPAVSYADEALAAINTV